MREGGHWLQVLPPVHPVGLQKGERERERKKSGAVSEGGPSYGRAGSCTCLPSEGEKNLSSLVETMMKVSSDLVRCEGCLRRMRRNLA